MKGRFSSAREVATLSDSGELVQRWQAPFFEKSLPASPSQAPVAGLKALAQAQGYQVGKEEGLAAGISEAGEIVSRMTDVADALAKPFRGLDALVATELARMAMLLAKQIVRRELTIDSTVVADIASQAMSTLYKLDCEIVVFLNPVDAAYVRELSPAPEVFEGKSWKIVEDDNLSPGGCQVKTPTSFVDASVENQMEVIFSNLIQSCENMAEQ